MELEDEIDLSRGEMLVAAPEAGDALPEVSRRFRAMVVWMHEEPLVVGRTYIAKHTTRTVRATVRAIRYRVDVDSLDQVAAERLAMNEIAEVEFETNLPLFFDAYAENRSTGCADSDRWLDECHGWRGDDCWGGRGCRTRMQSGRRCLCWCRAGRAGGAGSGCLGARGTGSGDR